MTKEEKYQEINQLKKEKNAIILAHYYVDKDIQDIADYVGDSLYLSQVANTTDADIIVFAGVHFMAETAKILSPEKKVLLPALEAGCPMANMINEKQLKEYKQNNPDTIIICYVNSTASVKALSDVCVTSSNAHVIMMHYAKLNKPMLYCPDQNLGKYVMKKYGLNFDVWKGFCCIHHNLTVEDVKIAKEKFPNALLVVHPEAQLPVLDLADYVGSTKGLLEYVTKSPNNEFIIGTEAGVIHQMQKHNPNKKFHLLSENLKCYDMKLNTLDDVLHVLRTEENEITVDEEVIKKASLALNKMLELS